MGKKLKYGLWYLAHPYRGDHEENFNQVNKIASKLIKQGVMVYSPVSHTHPISEAGGMDGDDLGLWLKLDELFMKKCNGIILCPGWEDSEGCNVELEYFLSQREMVYFYIDGELISREETTILPDLSERLAICKYFKENWCCDPRIYNPYNNEMIFSFKKETITEETFKRVTCKNCSFWYPIIKTNIYSDYILSCSH